MKVFMLLSQQAFVIRRRVQMVVRAAWRQQVLGPALANLATLETIAHVSTLMTLVIYLYTC